MSLADRLRGVPTGSGVYCMLDMAGLPVYAGRSSNLRSRLRQHFIRQDSSVVSYGRLDVRDVSIVAWWQTDNDRAAEQALISEYNPYLNFDDTDKLPNEVLIDIRSPDGTVMIRPEDEKRGAERPYVRAQQKLEHLTRLLDKVDFADHSPKTQKAIYAHLSILRSLIDEYLDVPSADPLEEHRCGDTVGGDGNLFDTVGEE